MRHIARGLSRVVVHIGGERLPKAVRQFVRTAAERPCFGPPAVPLFFIFCVFCFFPFGKAAKRQSGEW